MYRRVQQKLQETEFDAYLINSEANKNWLCNKDNYFFPAVLLLTKDMVYLFSNSRNLETIRENYAEYQVLKGDIDKALDKFKELQLNNLAFEDDLLSWRQYQQISERLAGYTLLPGGGFIEELRMVKTEEEISLLRQAAVVSDRGFTAFLAELKPGLTERQAKNILVNKLYQAGADGLSFDVLLSSGAKSFVPHAESSERVLQKGDLVLIDFGVKKDGYCSDTTRTVCLGKADPLQKERYELVLKAQKYAIDNITAGMTTGEADALARKLIMAEEPDGCYDYGLGHGIGMQVHEKPRMRPGSDDILPAYTTVSVEPGIYIKEWGGIRIEDIIVIMPEGANEVLSSLPKELLELD